MRAPLAGSFRPSLAGSISTYDMQEGSDIAVCVGLTEVGRWQDNGWKMTPEEWGKIRSGDPVFVYSESGERRLARFVTGAQHFSAKVIFEGKTELSPVAAINIGR